MSSRRRTLAKFLPEVPRQAFRFIAIMGFIVVLGVQSARVVERNIHVSRQVAQEEAQIQILQEQKHSELRAIARLQRPDGAIPEIHNRLKYGLDNEAIVFVRHPGDGANAIVGP